MIERNPTTLKRNIPTLWIGVRNGRKAFQIEWTPDGPGWFSAGPLKCHNYSLREWRLILDGKLLGTRIYETAQAAMRTAQQFRAVSERLAR